MVTSKIDLNYQNAYGYIKGTLQANCFSKVHQKTKLETYSSIDPSCRILVYLSDMSASISHLTTPKTMYIELSKTQCFDLLPPAAQKLHVFSDNILKGGLEIYDDDADKSVTLTMILDEKNFKKAINNPSLKTSASESGFLKDFQNNQYTFDVTRPITMYTGIIRGISKDVLDLGPSFTYILNESAIHEIIKNIPDVFASAYVKVFIKSSTYKKLIADVPNLYQTPTFDEYMNKLIFNDPATLDEFNIFFEKFNHYHTKKFVEQLMLTLVPTKYIQALTGRALMNNISKYSLTDILTSAMPTSYIISRYTPNFNLKHADIETH